MKTNKSASSWPLSNLHASELTPQELHETHGGYNLDDSKHLAKGIAIVLLTTLFGAAAGGVGYLTWKYHDGFNNVKFKINALNDAFELAKKETDIKRKGEIKVKDFYKSDENGPWTLEDIQGDFRGRGYINAFFSGKDFDLNLRYDPVALYKRLRYVYRPNKNIRVKTHAAAGVGGLAGLGLGLCINKLRETLQEEPVLV